MYGFLRVIAVGFLVAAILPRTGGDSSRLLVLAIGAPIAETLDSAGGRGRKGAVARLVGSGLNIDLYGWRGAAPAQFWRMVFDGSERTSYGVDQLAIPPAHLPLWASLGQGGGRAVAIGVPGTTTLAHRNGVLVASVPLESQFLGSSYGFSMDAARVAEGPLPWPYGEVIENVRKTASALADRQWSSWIAVQSGEREGLFKLYRSVSGRYYFSPCYEVTAVDAGSDAPRLFRQPSWPVDIESPEALFEFAGNLSARPFRFARAKIDADWSLFVYFDSLPGAVATVARRFRDTVTYADATRASAESLRQAESDIYRRFDERVGAMVAAAGADACVALIVDLETSSAASENDDERYASPIARMTLVCGDRLRGHTKARVTDVAATLAYLLGVPAPEGGTGSVIPEVVEQMGRVVARAAKGVGPDRESETMALTAETLIKLGGPSRADAEVSSAPLP